MIIFGMFFALIFTSAFSMNTNDFITLPDCTVLKTRLIQAGFRDLCSKTHIHERLGWATIKPYSLAVLVGGLCDENPKLPIDSLDIYLLSLKDIKYLPESIPYTLEEKRKIATIILQDFPALINELDRENLLDDSPISNQNDSQAPGQKSRR